MNRTRVKIRGLTRMQDVQAAVEAGAGAVGCHSDRPRHVDSPLLSCVRAVRMFPGVDLLNFNVDFPTVSALLADAPVDGYSGSGGVLDWSMLATCGRRGKPLILAAAIAAVRPYAVDVSSGDEAARGIKSAGEIRRFIAAVRAADTNRACA